MDDKERLQLHLAVYERMNGPEDQMPWTRNCLTPSLGEVNSQLGAYIAMYVRPNGDMEFVFTNTGSGVKHLELALAIYTQEPLTPDLTAAMEERDAALHARNPMPGEPGSNEFGNELLRRLMELPRHNGTWLPTAIVGLYAAAETGRTHLDLLCFSEVPAVAMWTAFHRDVVGAIIGL